MTITTHVDKLQTATVTVNGRLDRYEVTEFSSAITEVAHYAETIKLDFSRVPFIDMKAIRAVLGWQMLLKLEGRRLRVVALSQQARDILETTDVLDLLTEENSL